MACSTKVRQLIKLNTATGIATPIGDPFLFDGTPYTEELVECPDSQILATDVCTEDPADPLNCFENVKCLIEIEKSCVDGTVTQTVLGYTHNGISYEPGDLNEIPCPKYDVVATNTCPV